MKSLEDTSRQVKQNNNGVSFICKLYLRVYSFNQYIKNALFMLQCMVQLTKYIFIHARHALVEKVALEICFVHV
jgi:hypothetical protein